MQLTEEQILSLAPDESSRKAGKELANPAKWVSKGINDIALWGECQGSGAKPYQTQVDIANIAFKCSCPSRKFPCKHGLGLMLIYARQSDSFTDSTAPAWVTDWISKRSEREGKKTEAPISKPVDKAAKAKSKVAREQQVEDGIAELLRWMKDIVRNGILNMPEKNPSFFSEMAKRMVDAKAPGLAGMVRSLGDIHFYKEGWQSQFLDQLCRLYLVTSGFMNRSRIAPELVEDIRSKIGFTYSQEELRTQTGISDTWFVLGKQTTDDDVLFTERNWLYGATSGRYALVLQFSVRGQGMAFSLSPGMQIQAELIFFPSAQPLRAIIQDHRTVHGEARYTPYAGWLEVAEAAATVYGKLPFDAERPYIVQQLTPVVYNESFWLRDTEGRLVQIKEDFGNMFTLFSISGGHQLDMAVVGRDQVYEPVGVWSGGQYYHL